MESLESRMERLTLEQRREVEDFMDFLLLKNNIRQGPVSVPSPPPVMMNTPPVLSSEEPSFPRQSPVRMQDSIIRNEPRPPVITTDQDSSPVRENNEEGEDWITRDYMDYGKFDQSFSPATEAVKKVKQKINARESEDNSRRLLDWVD